MRRILAILFSVFVLAAVAGDAFARRAERRHTAAPLGVSPGSAEGFSGAARCATFTWGYPADALEYELAVYRLDSDGDPEPAPFLSRRIPGAALSFTPPAERCPTAGGLYAWAVRAIGEQGPSPWSAPLFFAVERRPSDDAIPERDQVAWALEVLSHAPGDLQVADSRERAPAPRSSAARGTAEARAPRRLDAADGAEGVVRAPSGVIVDPGNSHAHLKVAGEVRTIDPADPNGPARLWGRGRGGLRIYGAPSLQGEMPCSNGAAKRGLSDVGVDWGSAADACPVGTWVCTQAEAGVDTCNTIRPDHTFDGLACNGSGLSWMDTAHLGWIADAAPPMLAVSPSGLAWALDEQGAYSSNPTCTTLPVWCCWE